MAHPKTTRATVRRAYIFSQLSLQIAAAQAAVSFVTARRWKKDAQDSGDDWDRLRAANVIAGGGMEEVARGLLLGLVTQYQSTLESVSMSELPAAQKVDMLASLADAFSKATAASKRILPEVSQLATSLEVLQKLAAFIAERYPQHLGAFAEILEPFGEEIEKTKG